ncbi:MAG: hypothetical protein LC781_06540 [Actinobacteria bacterium]|nr:hypothetical protein [Actinomycetota bacterium]
MKEEVVRSPEFYDRVTAGGGAVTENLFELFEEKGIRYCVVGGQAVNHYVEPLVSLDLDLVVATDQLEAVEALLAERFDVRRFPHSLNVTPPASDLRIQIQTDPRYNVFVDRAERGNVLGITMPVASVRDVLQGKVWAAQDPSRRPSKRRKDLLDIERLVEVDPSLRESVPLEILQRIEP